ncbi:MAG: hypothetical protein K9N47_25060 [Prosthecobacter sp.]|uniref:hypothetical protein n=1 Tax=Prosthecobacter sp. TaxID=1965333 RepID=UPI00261753C7|nr:hypothetical protein [Prosthecobacter sp.]MCF7789416.1 hypothetical protein [Prosthecobacter sp.]
MTVRDTIATLLSYLRPEQRSIPYAGGSDYEDPLPDALAACNAALQQMAALGPLFAAKQQRSAYFRAPTELAVSGLTHGGMTATGSFPSWAAGCWVDLPGDPAMNRILSITETTATLQFPHLSDSTSGTATVNVDTVELDGDIITVLEPVRFRGSKRVLTAANGREELSQSCGDVRYFIESAISNGAVKLRMMISGYVSTDTVLEFQARTALGELTRADVYNNDEGHTDPGVALPVPANFVESIFLPLALDAFFAKPTITNYDIPSLRNQDAPSLIHQQAQTALVLLERMRPQGRKPVGIWPAWSSGRY